MTPPMIVARLVAASLFVVAGQEAFAEQRQRMVREQIAARGVRDRAVLEVMRTVPRERFVPPGMRAQAYADLPLLIGYEQTISQPYIVALMTELLGVGKEHRVLEIGTGSGYQAAVLAGLVETVYSIELVPELARSAAQTLAAEGYRNVQVRAGDGYLGWPEHAPFDRIILTAAPPEIPSALVAQLKAGGRLVAPVGEEWQDLVVLEKGRDGKTSTRKVLPVRFVPMKRGGK
jgi:protein-L-isoaspartate(D-aspartate) O-methyltransferase